MSETGTRRPPRPEPGQAPQTRAEDAGRASRPAAAPTAQSASPYGPYPGRAGPRGLDNAANEHACI